MDALIVGISLGFEIFASFFVLQVHVQLNFKSNWAPIVWLHVVWLHALNQKNERDWFKLLELHGMFRCCNVLFTC